MLSSKKSGGRRFNLNNWSAPAIMSAFLFICMIVIFSIENIGLSNREKNVELRVTSLENRNFFIYISEHCYPGVSTKKGRTQSNQFQIRI